jgi:hypothetical protein
MTETQTKVCTKCKIEKVVNEFNKQATGRFGVKSQCKVCQNAHGKEYEKVNAEKIAIRKSGYYKEIKNGHRLQYRTENAEKIAERNREYVKKNKAKISQKNREYIQKNYEKIISAKKEYAKKNTKKIYARLLERMNKDDFFASKIKVRKLISRSIHQNGYSKSSKTEMILCCSYEEFKTHIESQFLDGMNWNNRNEWHIDHFIPLASAKTESEILKLNHYTNLRPMWAADNIRKGAKMPHEHNY